MNEDAADEGGNGGEGSESLLPISPLSPSLPPTMPRSSLPTAQNEGGEIGTTLTTAMHVMVARWNGSEERGRKMDRSQICSQQARPAPKIWDGKPVTKSVPEKL